jgi:hypothetical protein
VLVRKIRGLRAREVDILFVSDKCPADADAGEFLLAFSKTFQSEEKPWQRILSVFCLLKRRILSSGNLHYQHLTCVQATRSGVHSFHMRANDVAETLHMLCAARSCIHVFNSARRSFHISHDLHSLQRHDVASHACSVAGLPLLSNSFSRPLIPFHGAKLYFSHHAFLISANVGLLVYATSGRFTGHITRSMQSQHRHKPEMARSG